MRSCGERQNRRREGGQARPRRNLLAYGALVTLETGVSSMTKRWMMMRTLAREGAWVTYLEKDFFSANEGHENMVEEGDDGAEEDDHEVA